MDAFVRAYIEAALWSTNDESTPEGGEPLDENYDLNDISTETINAMTADCRKFQEQNADDLANCTDEQGGYDFWLTRNRHGAGFWDRDYLGEDVKERLTEASHAFGEENLYVGDDGKIYA